MWHPSDGVFGAQPHLKLIGTYFGAILNAVPDLGFQGHVSGKLVLPTSPAMKQQAIDMLTKARGEKREKKKEHFESGFGVHLGPASARRVMRDGPHSTVTGARSAAV